MLALLYMICLSLFLQSKSPCTISLNVAQSEVVHQSNLSLLYFLTSGGDIQWPF